MPLHPSLKIDSAIAQQRSVLSRIERIKDLMRKGLWAQGSPVTGLPKTKIVRIKAKKAAKEAAPAAGAAGAEGATAPAASGAPAASVAGAKTAASPKAPKK